MIEFVYTINQLKEVKNILERGKHVNMDVQTAGYIINYYLSDKQFKSFVDKGTKGLENSKFAPLTYNQRVKGYYTNELVQQSNRNLNLQAARELVKNCETYAQHYDFKIDDPTSKIFIERTPTKLDFDISKNILVNLLKNIGSESPMNINGITMIGIHKENSINFIIEKKFNKAIMGFEFR